MRVPGLALGPDFVEPRLQDLLMGTLRSARSGRKMGKTRRACRKINKKKKNAKNLDFKINESLKKLSKVVFV